jgi:hypothetical protein
MKDVSATTRQYWPVHIDKPLLTYVPAHKALPSVTRWVALSFSSTHTTVTGKCKWKSSTPEANEGQQTPSTCSTTAGHMGDPQDRQMRLHCCPITNAI